MKLQNLRCPCCTGTLHIMVKGNEYIFCPYCGEQFFVDDGRKEYNFRQDINITKVSRHTNHYIDEADVIRAATADRESKSAWKYALLSIIIIFSMIGFCLFMMGTEDRVAARAQKAGKISAGTYEDYEGEDFEAVVEQLTALGFTNITCVELDDSGALFWRSGKVESVSIEGDTTFYSYNYFYPDVTIVVTYH